MKNEEIEFAKKYFIENMPKWVNESETYDALGYHGSGAMICQDPEGYAYKTAIEALEMQEADGCNGCAFEDVEEWEMPCAKCKRNCKDYWRARVCCRQRNSRHGQNS